MNTTIPTTLALRGLPSISASLAAAGVTRSGNPNESELHRSLELLDAMPSAGLHRKMLAVITLFPIRGLLMDARSQWALCALLEALQAEAQDLPNGYVESLAKQTELAVGAARECDELLSRLRGLKEVDRTGAFYAAQAADFVVRGNTLGTFKSVIAAIRCNDPAHVVEDSIQSLCNQMNALVVMLLDH